MYTLVLLRHGQSEFNAQKRFTGWTDPTLTEQGVREATRAGQLLRSYGYRFTVAYTSVLSRAIKTLWLALDAMDLTWLPTIKDYRLNERHYGALQGHTHAEKIAEVGESQVFTWRRSFSTRPPALELDDPRHPKFDPRYANLSPDVLPACESLEDTIARVQPVLEKTILPAVQAGEKILISAHGNSLRAIVKYLDGISDEDIRGVNIPTGVPLVYTFDENMNVLSSQYLEE